MFGGMALVICPSVVDPIYMLVHTPIEGPRVIVLKKEFCLARNWFWVCSSEEEKNGAIGQSTVVKNLASAIDPPFV